MPKKVLDFCVKYGIIWITDDELKKIKFKKNGRRVDVRLDYLTFHTDKAIEEIKKGLMIYDKTW